MWVRKHVLTLLSNLKQADRVLFKKKIDKVSQTILKITLDFIISDRCIWAYTFV